MTELNPNHSPSPAFNNLEALQERVSDRRERFRQSDRDLARIRTSVVDIAASPSSWLKRLPKRYVLHTVVALTVPVALALSYLPTRPPLTPAEQHVVVADAPLSLGPISLDSASSQQPLLGDPPLDDVAALPLPLSVSSGSEVFAPRVLPAKISGDVVKLRNGPGLEYDVVTKLDGGTGIEVLGRRGDWLQIHKTGTSDVFWVADELVDLPEAVQLTIAEVPSAVIPPPPPPKVGQVIEDKLNLRDGPGTNYVSMAKMAAGQDLTLIEQYQGWFLVEYGGIFGWVDAEFMKINAGVTSRVPVATKIPDPNPALVGSVIEGGSNLRKGPGSAYDRVTTAKAGQSLTVLARYKDWFKVQLDNGTKAWIFSDLVAVAPMVKRRVPATSDIPALPVKAKPKPAPAAAARPRPAPASGGQGQVTVSPSGDVAGFATQFIGSRYIWGGASPGGFDCSGLTQYVYRQFGVGLPHSAAGQFSGRYGAIISSMSNLAPGDLMFFAGTGGGRGITHVAIYIGGGSMVHAMTPRLGVQASGIWGSYWQSHFAGAIRPYR